MEDVEEVKKKGKGKESRYGKRYGFEFKLRCVKLGLEEGIPIPLLSKEVGASKDVIRRWAKAYQERGEAGLRKGVVPAGNRQKLPGPVREKIVEIKKREPFFGVKRISHLLKRAFFPPARGGRSGISPPSKNTVPIPRPPVPRCRDAFSSRRA